MPNESDSRIPGAELQKHDQIKALERLEQLRDKGILTEQEFELQKNSILKEMKLAIGYLPKTRDRSNLERRI